MERMAQSSYKAGIIGLGFIGAADQVSGDALGQQVEDLDDTHWTALAGNPQVEVVAGSSRDAGRRQRFEARSGARTYADWGRMIEEEALDIVSVATYTPVHAEITAACAARGIRVIYCEKPIATTPAQGDAMLSACAASGSLLVINHNRRFNPNFRCLRQLIADGGLGDLTSVTTQWSSGRLGNVGTHVFDAVCMVTGRRVEAVSGMLDLAGKPDCRGTDFSDPGGWGMLRLQGGLVATVDAADYGAVPMVIAFNGTKGRASGSEDEIRIDYGDGRTEVWDASQKTAMTVAVEEIVAWLDSGQPFPYKAETAVHVLEAIAAFHLSHGRRGAWVELPLSGEERDTQVHSG
jgi:predicted dehydrogenase